MNHKPKNNKLSEAEKNLFRDAMKGTQSTPKSPLPPQSSQSKTSSHYPQMPKSSRPHPSSSFNLELTDTSDWHSAEDSIRFARSGLQHKILTQLKRGNMPIEAQLDLHRLTSNEAMTRVESFITQCQNQRKRCVCIIHGKGYLSQSDKPILKNLLNQWLRENKAVLAFHSAQAKDGGAGAVYVLIKSNRGKHEK